MTLRNRKPLFALIAATAAVLSLPAMAQDAPPTQDQARQQQEMQMQQAQQATGNEQSWATLDKDGDGNVSRNEAQAHAGLSQIFDAADSDKDGKLTPDEYRNYTASQQK